jgi:hypothetical protein
VWATRFEVHVDQIIGLTDHVERVAESPATTTLACS